MYCIEKFCNEFDRDGKELGEDWRIVSQHTHKQDAEKQMFILLSHGIEPEKLRFKEDETQ